MDSYYEYDHLQCWSNLVICRICLNDLNTEISFVLLIELYLNMTTFDTYSFFAQYVKPLSFMQ
jgi:hypothetical protein